MDDPFPPPPSRPKAKKTTKAPSARASAMAGIADTAGVTRAQPAVLTEAQMEMLAATSMRPDELPARQRAWTGGGVPDGVAAKPGSQGMLRSSVTIADVEAVLLSSVATGAAKEIWAPTPETSQRIGNLLAPRGGAYTVVTSGAGRALAQTLADFFTPPFLRVISRPRDDAERERVRLTRGQQSIAQHLLHGDFRLVLATLMELLALEWAVLYYLPPHAVGSAGDAEASQHRILLVFQSHVLPDGVLSVRELPAIGVMLATTHPATSPTPPTSPTSPPIQVVRPIFPEDVATLPNKADCMWTPPGAGRGPLACRRVMWLEPATSVQRAPATHYWSEYTAATTTTPPAPTT